MRIRILLLIFITISGSNIHSNKINEKPIPQQADNLARQIAWPGFIPSEVKVALLHEKTNDLSFFNDELFFIKPKNEIFTQNDVSQNSNSRKRETTIKAESFITTTHQAGQLVIERFRIFQQNKYPSWSYKDAAFNNYPVDNMDNNLLILVENYALVEALKSTKKSDVIKWLRTVLKYRNIRYSKLSKEDIKLERSIELSEGILIYINDRITDSDILKKFTPNQYNPDQIKLRFMYSGAAICHLLDRLSLNWKNNYNEDNNIFLDKILYQTLVNQLKQ